MSDTCPRCGLPNMSSDPFHQQTHACNYAAGLHERLRNMEERAERAEEALREFRDCRCGECSGNFVCEDVAMGFWKALEAGDE